MIFSSTLTGSPPALSFTVFRLFEQLVVFQHLIMKLLTGTAKGLFTVGIAHNGGHRVKEGQVGRLIPLGL